MALFGKKNSSENNIKAMEKERKRNEKEQKKLHKKQTKILKGKNKEVEKNKKQMASTLNWMDVETVKHDRIYLKKGKKTGVIAGVKIMPHNIFIEDERQVYRIIDKYRLVFNKFPHKIYWGMVFNPVDIDVHLAKLYDELSTETEPVIKRMINSDIEKAMLFCDTHKELEFFWMIREENDEKLDMILFELYQELDAQNIYYAPLYNKDFKHYIASAFENELITDYHFSAGIFRPYTLEDIQLKYPDNESIKNMNNDEDEQHQMSQDDEGGEDE